MRSAAHLAGVPERLWAEARSASLRLLAIDYDGTLAPFAVDPADAHPLPGARRALGRLVRAGRTSLAIVSGRPAEDVARLLHFLPVWIVGEHGWALRFPDGAQLRQPIHPAMVRRLDAVEAAVAGAAESARVERKRTSIVVHTRGLEPRMARAAERAARHVFAERFDATGLALRPIDGGVELRAAGRDKGTAIIELAERLGSEVFVVAIGDDDTDEDAFRAAAELGGWGVKVGAERATAARARLASPAEVAAFLESWDERVDGEVKPARREAGG
jgi:trehalose-phosphatase